jgi:uncharacterized protein (DUF305 family)
MRVGSLLTVIAAASCATASQRSPAAQPAPVAPYTAADVSFMAGMIGHHAQAVLMAGWAPSHGASPSLRALCERIVNGQRDEIVLMQRWLRERHEAVPDADASHDMMPGMGHPMMPGMLTAEQLAQLDHATGPQFDRLFLTFMIRHHQGAVVMVNQLFASQGGGEQETVFRFASDVYADQTTEIDRMQKLFVALLTESQP